MSVERYLIAVMIVLVCGLSVLVPAASSSLLRSNSPPDLACMSEDLQPFYVRWWSRDRVVPELLTDGAVIQGDQISVEAVFPRSRSSPEENVASISWTASSGMVVNRSGSLVIPDDGCNPFGEDIDLAQFAWERIDGINRGDNVRLSVRHTNIDTDVLVFWNAPNKSLWRAETSILGYHMATGRVGIETGDFIADRSGCLMVGIYSFDHQSGEYTLTLDTSEIQTGDCSGNAFTCSTWQWGKNITLDFTFAGVTVSGSPVTHTLSHVTFENFFSPSVGNIRVSMGGTIKSIMWEVSDRNLYEEHRYEVLISRDAGRTFQLLAGSLHEAIYIWDTAGFEEFDRCQIQVRAFDSIGLEGVGFSPVFMVSSSKGNSSDAWFTVSSPSNSTYIWGSSGHSVSWTIDVVDDIPLPYMVKVDDCVRRTGWTVTNEIWINTDDLDVGLHEVTLIIETGSSQYNASVYVKVLPNPDVSIPQFLNTACACILVFIVATLLEHDRRSSQR
jgi:hypothetical protein